MKKTFIILWMLLAASVMNAAGRVTLTVSNPLRHARVEMVEVDADLVKKKLDMAESIIVTDADGKEIPSQLTWDGKLIFRAGVGEKGKSVYYVERGTPRNMK